MARICNQVQEVATDLNCNLPRLFQETKEIRRETQQLAMAYNQVAAENTRLHEQLADHQRETAERFLRLESRFAEFQDSDRTEKGEVWSKLCTKKVVQDLADRVGCLDQESHAKFHERKQEYEKSLEKTAAVGSKVDKALDDFQRGIGKAEYLTSQAALQQREYKKASERAIEEHREMIDSIVFPRIERAENLLNQEMCERIDCLKKIAHELVHAKEQSDRMKEQVDRMCIDIGNCMAEAGTAGNNNMGVGCGVIGSASDGFTDIPQHHNIVTVSQTSAVSPGRVLQSPRMAPRYLSIAGLKGLGPTPQLTGTLGSKQPVNQLPPTNEVGPSA